MTQKRRHLCLKVPHSRATPFVLSLLHEKKSDINAGAGGGRGGGDTGAKEGKTKDRLFQNTVYFPAQRCLIFQKVLKPFTPPSTLNLTHHSQRACI